MTKPWTESTRKTFHVILAATGGLTMVCEAAPHAATAWIEIPGFFAIRSDLIQGPLPVPDATGGRRPVTIRGLHADVPVPRDRFGLLSGQVIMIKRTGSRAGPVVANVKLVRPSVGEDRPFPAEETTPDETDPGVSWRLSAGEEGGNLPIDLFRFPTRPPQAAGVQGERPPELLPLWINAAPEDSAALSGEYSFVLTRAWDAIDPDGCAPIVPTDGETPAALLDTGVHRLFAGDWDGAGQAFRRLAASDDPAIAAVARQCLRRVRAARRIAEADEASDAGFAYDAALYAWANGFYDLALGGFRRAATLAPTDSQALYHLAEMEERAGADVRSVAEILDRAGCLANATPNVWDVLVTILMEETTPDGGLVRMKETNVERIVEEWQVVEMMVHGASLGHYKLNTTFRVIPDTNAVPYVQNAGWLYGPDDGIVPMPGMYDCCMSFRPAGPSVTGGADCGPNGAAMTDIGTWCGWEVYLHEWNHQFDWGMITSEIGVGYPVTHDSDGCGPQPIPSMGAGHRGSMRYYVTPAMYRRVELADAVEGAAIRSWAVAGPIPLPVAEGDDPPRLLEAAWTDDEADLVQGGDADLAWRTWAAESDLVDLNKVLGTDGVENVGAYARAFVYSPESREVRLWLGHNDGMRVWVNGVLVHEGRYFSIAKWEDANRPDSVVSWARLEPGWNRIFCKVQKWDGGWGFSVRPCDFDGSTPGGVRYSAEGRTPAAVARSEAGLGRYYRWDDVASDFTSALPRWEAADLQAYTGLAGLELRGGPHATKGAVAFVVGDGAAPVPGSRFGDDPDAEADGELNNVMSWATEGIAALRFERGGVVRDLLLIRPESVEPVMRLLEERGAPRAVPRLAADRLLGYVMTFAGTSPRALLLVEVWLGDWPAEEEELYRIGGPERTGENEGA